METIKVTATYDAVLRSAVELTERQVGEGVFEQQARGLDELGYAIVRKEDAARLAWLRSERTLRARELVLRYAGLLRRGAPFTALRNSPEAIGGLLRDALDEGGTPAGDGRG